MEPPGKRYIVKLHSFVEKDRHLNQLLETRGDHSAITHSWTPNFINAYAGTFHSAVASYLRQHHEVDYIEEDLPMFTCELKEQNDAPWHLQRINQDAILSDTSVDNIGRPYTYDSSAGAGVDIYILDSGIDIDHEDFDGRARWGKKFVDTDTNDKNGHGTHVAGIAAGERWGVAKAANLIAVKVGGDAHKGEDGNHGNDSDLIAGLEWVFLEAKASGRPSVVNISRGHDVDDSNKSKSVHDAIGSTTNAGIHVVVAAGNGNMDASKHCPANAPTAITVGASNIKDERDHSSNYGSAVDVFAPGKHITSCLTNTKNGTTQLSGTSMAAPVVAGIIARLISMNGNSSPSAMTETLKRQGAEGVLVASSIPENTVNLLARCCVRTWAVFSFKSSFAQFSVVKASSSPTASPNPSFRKADNVPDSIYDGMSWLENNTLRWGNGTDVVEGIIPLLIVNDGSIVSILLRRKYGIHDKDDDYYAHARVAFCDYECSQEKASQWWYSCPVKTESVRAIFSFKADSAKVTVTKKGDGACLRRVRDGIVNPGYSSKSLEWEKDDASTDDHIKELPYIIINPGLVTDISLSIQSDANVQGDWAETSFANCTYFDAGISIATPLYKDCPVKTQTVFASFRFKSNWAEFGVTTPGTTVRKDPGAPADAYKDVVFTDKSLQWGTSKSQTYADNSIPFLIVGAYPLVDIGLGHGSDGAKSGDGAGSCNVNFGNRTYSSGSGGKATFDGCPMQTVIANALLSFESNWAKVELPAGAFLQMDSNADVSIYDKASITTNSLSWGSEFGTVYVTKTLPFQILIPSPGLNVDICISRGTDARKPGDGVGFGIVKFGSRKYINNKQATAGVRNELLFNGCKLQVDNDRVPFDQYA